MGIEWKTLYEKALAHYKAERYEESLSMVRELRAAVERWPRALLLEAYLYRDTKRYLAEIRILWECLAQLDLRQADERKQAATAWSLLGDAWRILGDSRRAVEAFLRSADLEPDLGKARTECCNALFSASGIWDMEAAEFRYLYDVYQGKFREIVPYPDRRYHHERLRIGYLSADLCEHPVASLLYPLLQYHDRSRFRVYCYSATAHEDHVTALLREKAEIWRDIADAADAEAAETIRQDEIDILFDLSVHTKDSRLSLLAYRPATVQISGIGDVNSTGLPAVDYFLTDCCCMEERAMRDFFVERPLCLPHCHFCYAPLKEMPEPAAAPCLERGYVTFGSFNNFGKMTDEVLALWCRILRAVPGSRLILKHQLFDSEEGRSFVREKLERIGFPLSRVELRGFSKTYLQEYRELDIALDTHPYTGGITTLEALYMGVPVISLYGRRHGTRFGYSFLQNIGLEELAADSPDAYVEVAVSLAKDEALLALLHGNLRQMMQDSPLMDGAQYAKDMERLYEEIWRRKADE